VSSKPDADNIGAKASSTNGNTWPPSSSAVMGKMVPGREPFGGVFAQTAPRIRVGVIHAAGGNIGRVEQVSGEPRLAKDARELDAVVQ